MKKKLLAVLIALISVITLAFALPACNVSSDGRGSANNGANPGGNNNDETTEFSDILSNILTEENRDLWQKVYDNGFRISNDVKPIPYKFLRNHGHNVSAYLDGTLDVFASSYIYDNDKNHIYVSVKAENVSYSQYGNYYTNYVLKYPLTNQEYEEYTYLCKGGYVQGLFYIQELDNQKTPEIVNKINVQKETYNKMIKQYTKSNNINFKKYFSIDMDIYTFNTDEIEISIRNGSSSNMFSNNIGFITLLPNPTSAGVESYDNNVMKLGNAAKVNYKNLEEYQSSLQNITSFSYGTNISHTNPYNVYDVK